MCPVLRISEIAFFLNGPSVRPLVLLIIYIDTDILVYVNYNWVATRWQQYSTHLHTNSTQSNTITLVGRFSGIRTQSGQTKIKDELTA
jgi:hypothetical protein